MKSLLVLTSWFILLLLLTGFFTTEKPEFLIMSLCSAFAVYLSHRFLANPDELKRYHSFNLTADLSNYCFNVSVSFEWQRDALLRRDPNDITRSIETYLRSLLLKYFSIRDDPKSSTLPTPASTESILNSGLQNTFLGELSVTARVIDFKLTEKKPTTSTGIVIGE